MESSNNFSSRGVYVGSVISCAIVIALWLITNNFWVVGGALFIVPLLMAKLIHKEVTKRGKVSVIILMVILFAICGIFFRKDTSKDTQPKVDEPVIVTQDESEDNSDQDEDAQIEDQKVTSNKKGGYGSAKPKPEEVIPPKFSNVGGDSSGSNVNKGEVIVKGDETTVITSPDDTSKEYEDQIKNDIENGKDVTEIDDGIKVSVDNKPKEEEKKDESTKIDIDSEKDNIKDTPSGKEEPKLPDPLPDDEQLKQDAEEIPDDELDQIVDKTEPEEKPSDSNKEDTETDSDKPIQGDNDKSDTDKKDDEVKQDDKENNDSDLDNKVDQEEENKPEEIVKTPVTIAPLDGNKAIAGDSVQFKVTGNVKSIEGLEGLNYTYTNGYITVNTRPGEATVITPVVIGADGTSTATTSVTVNVLK